MYFLLFLTRVLKNKAKQKNKDEMNYESQVIN